MPVFTCRQTCSLREESEGKYILLFDEKAYYINDVMKYIVESCRTSPSNLESICSGVRETFQPIPEDLESKVANALDELVRLGLVARQRDNP